MADHPRSSCLGTIRPGVCRAWRCWGALRLPQPTRWTLASVVVLAALSPQRFDALRHSGGVELQGPSVPLAKNVRALTHPTPRAFQAISLGYFSLGQQRKVTRPSGRKRRRQRPTLTRDQFPLSLTHARCNYSGIAPNEGWNDDEATFQVVQRVRSHASNAAPAP
jgi:hypothetical protein